MLAEELIKMGFEPNRCSGVEHNAQKPEMVVVKREIHNLYNECDVKYCQECH